MSITQKELRHFFTLDAKSGILYWRVRPSCNSRARAGDVAGHLSCYGYWIIGVKKKIYRRARLVFLYVNGYMPETVDHNNEGFDTQDDRPCKLREATSKQQNQNRRGFSRKGLPKGVRTNKSRKNPFSADIYENGNYHYIGSYPTIEEAHAAYCEAAQHFFGDFACSLSIKK